MRKVYVLGEYGQIKGIVFPDINIISEMPDGMKKTAIGLDFGYTNDPTAAYLCGVIGDNLYIDQLIYEHALSNSQIAKRLPINIEAYCDSAEPKSIADLKRLGIFAKPTLKGRDSILYGINLLKSFKLHITARSAGILREQKLYKYKVGQDGQPTNKPIDDFNHAWDAVRYYALSKLSKPNRGILATL